MSAASQSSAPMVAVAFPADEQSSARHSTAPTKASSARSHPSLADRDDGTISDELETMLSLSQTFSFWDEGCGAPDARPDGACATDDDDDDSYGENSLESWGTEDDERDRRTPCRGVCGDADLEDATNVVLETLLDTSRAISHLVRHGSQAKKEIEKKLFPTKEEKAKAKKEKKERREEERRMTREQRLKDDMNRARNEAANVASMWREK